jgi:hypothetical protein
MLEELLGYHGLGTTATAVSLRFTDRRYTINHYCPVEISCSHFSGISRGTDLKNSLKNRKSRFKAAPKEIGLEPAPMLDLRLGTGHLTGQ